MIGAETHHSESPPSAEFCPQSVETFQSFERVPIPQRLYIGPRAEADIFRKAHGTLDYSDMEVQNLSSNWKKLQQTLQPKPKNLVAAVLGKRKAESTELSATKKVRHTPNIPRKVKEPSHSRAPKAEKDSKSRSKITPTSASPAKKEHRKAMGILYSKPSTEATPVGDAVDTAVATAAGVAAEDIPASQLRLARAPSSTSLRSFKDTINSGIVPSVAVGKYVAMDCEMVGVGPNPERSSMLARVSMVNFHGEQVYDSFVAPKEAVTDYRTHVSGITEALIRDARTFEQIQADVAGLLEGRILVGHAIRHDLDVLMLGHPKRDIRDTSRHKVYRELAGGRTPGLKRLAKEILGVEIQAGAHSSIEDARATMMLYRREKGNFEREHVRTFGVDRRHIRPEAIEGEVVAVKQQDEASKPRSNKKKSKRKR